MFHYYFRATMGNNVCKCCLPTAGPSARGTTYERPQRTTQSDTRVSQQASISGTRVRQPVTNCVFRRLTGCHRCFSENTTMFIHTCKFVIYPSPRGVSERTDEGRRICIYSQRTEPSVILIWFNPQWNDQSMRFTEWGGQSMGFTEWGGQSMWFTEWGGQSMGFTEWGGQSMWFTEWGGQSMWFTEWGGHYGMHSNLEPHMPAGWRMGPTQDEPPKECDIFPFIGGT